MLVVTAKEQRAAPCRREPDKWVIEADKSNGRPPAGESQGSEPRGKQLWPLAAGPVATALHGVPEMNAVSVDRPASCCVAGPRSYQGASRVGHADSGGFSCAVLRPISWPLPWLSPPSPPLLPQLLPRPAPRRLRRLWPPR